MADEQEKLELTTRQRKAIAALLASPTIEDAAKKAGSSERTLYRYLSDPVFRIHLTNAESDTIDAATRQLLDLQGDALAAIRGILTDPDTSPSSRLRAAGLVLDYVLKYRTLRNVEGRLLALELSQLQDGSELDLWERYEE